ncbi:MAG: hypothetical protein A2252_06885 [Elusimicrobia bacterium RIFOXYA2_FULL_39_19]|nr:MAG: hypothetical protein A2252_06885 [Elusimicrobia bacterium RIFOXYA2_FULL_39_19]
MKKLIIILLAIVFITGNSFCAFDDMYSTSIRAQGMGGAFCGLSDDAHSWLINPAGLGKIESTNIGLSYSQLYPGLVNDNISQNLVGVAYPKDNYIVGLTYASLSSQKYTELLYSISAAKQFFIDDLYFGINVKSLGWTGTELKYFNNTGESLAKTNFGVDLGVLYAVSEELDWGTNLINLNQPDIGSKIQEELPLKIRTGICYKYSEELNVLMDAEIDNNLIVGGPQFSAGIEKWFKEKQYAVRGGMQSSLEGNSISLGASYRKDMNKDLLGIEIAYILPMEMKQSSIMRFSLLYWPGTVKADKTEEVKEEQIEIPADEFEEVEEDLAPGIEEKKEEKVETPAVIVPASGSKNIEETIEMIKSGKIAGVKFDKNGKNITGGTETLDKIGQSLATNTKIKIKIESHTPTTGDPLDNIDISNNQAKKVKDYFIEKYKISADRIECLGWGGMMPIYDVEEEIEENVIDEEGMEIKRKVKRKIPENIEKNRRIEFSIIK